VADTTALSFGRHPVEEDGDNVGEFFLFYQEGVMTIIGVDFIIGYIVEVCP
jgi:hypothetical protein